MSGKNSSNLLKKVYFVALIVYLAAVFYITVLCREPENRRFDMEPFRSYTLWLHEGNDFYFSQILYNIIMTVPFGMIMPCLSIKFRSLRLMTFMGFGLSLIIEITQYITARGLFEFDDLFNNTLGTAVGYILFVIFHRKIVKMADSAK